MEKRLLTCLYLLLACTLFSQTKFDGVWQGMIQLSGAKPSEYRLFYVTFTTDKNTLTGKTREEIYETDLYAVQKIKGEKKEKSLQFKQFVVESKKNSSKITWCSADFEGTYDDSTGYLKGTFKSSTCRNYNGTFVLYRSKSKFAEKESSSLGHAWRDKFIADLKANRKAPEIREKERANFKFEPIYFDHNKTEIKTEYKSYLIDMIQVVNGHSDLRIQITGHTDSDGSEIYNTDLSRRRAESIKTFFKENGLDLKKLEIDFKGEKEPIDNNNTEEGKHKNRRVDFKFINE